MDYVLTSQTLWESFDPNGEQLDTDVIRVFHKGGKTVKYLYFTGRETRLGKSRVFATVCYKDTVAGKRAVLVVGDFASPIDEKVLLDLADRGFVAMSIDFAGFRQIGLFTLYPEDIDYCNYRFKQSMFEISETAEQTKLYEYSLNCRRAITYLLDEENVETISLLAVDEGVYTGLIVLGVDSRVSNGAILFGNLYRDFPERSISENMIGADEEELNRHIAYDMHRQMWTLGLAPQTYALQIKAPVYIVNSANSPQVDVMQTSKTFARVNGESRLLILPTSMDYLPKSYTDGVVQWLRGCEPPQKSDLKSFVDSNGDYCLRVTTSHPIEKTSVWYCTDFDGRARHWTKAALTQGEGCYIAKLNLYEKLCNVASFALFDGDVSISTPILSEKVTVANIKKANNIIFSGTGSQPLIPVCEPSMWWNVDLEPKLSKGYLKIVGAKGKDFATFAINDKSIRMNPAFTVGFDVCAKTRQQIVVTAVCKFGSKNERYVQSKHVVGNGKWERLTFDKNNFHREEDGKQILETEQVEMIIISADSDIIVNNIFLV